MKSKEKGKKFLKLTVKRLIELIAIILIVFYLVILYNFFFRDSGSYAKETISTDIKETKISNANKIDIDKMIFQNINNGMKEEFYVVEEVLEYITKYNSNSQLPKGTIQVIQEGRQGKQEITKKRIYEKDEIISDEQVQVKVTKSSINKIVEIGTGNYVNTYKAKVGDIIYSTSDRLAVMSESNENSQKVATLSKNTELKLKEIQNEWYRIISGNTRGFVKKESTTNINPNKPQNDEGQASLEEKSESELNSKISFGMSLNKPSGLSLEQLKKVLGDSKDKNGIFQDNAQYFYYIEKQYNINGIFVAAVGIHESAWGTSKIANDKNNLFGYGAYDSNPYNGAYTFSNYSESIDLIARVFVKYYLNPKGTSIYGGEQASGTYYNGVTLSGVNTKYATDKNWANAVYNHMKYLYGKL